MEAEKPNLLATEPAWPSFCHVHGHSEDCTTTTYKVCFECGHVYETEADLIRSVNQMFESIAAADGQTLHSNDYWVSGEAVYACPECAHDF